MTIIGDFFASIDAVFVSFFSSASAAVGTAARPVFNTLVTLYVLLWGFSMWRGLIQEPMSDGVVRIVKIVLIGTFALNAAVYAPRIATTIYKTPDQLANVLIPGLSTTSTGTALDNALAKGLDVGTRYTDAMSMLEPIIGLALFIQALIVWLLTLILVGYAAALILLAKIALSVVLGVGPLFIALLLFEPTRNFFTGWLAQALNSLFTYVIAVAFVALGIAFFVASADASLSVLTPGAAPKFRHLVPTVLVGGAVFVGLMQANAIAAALAGGIQVSTMGAVGWAMRRGAGVLTAPLRGYQSVRSFNDRRLARDYYRQRLGKNSSLSTRSIEWAKQRVRGANTVKKD